MQKQKIVYISDGAMPKAKLESPVAQELLKPLEEYADIVIVPCQEDMAGDAFTEYAEKFEKNGPEWYEPLPEVMSAVADADILLIHYACVPKKLIDAAKKCKLIVAMRSGVENINVKYANEKGIQVAFAPGRNGDPVADFAVGLLLSIDRSIVERELRNNDTNWRRDIGDFPQYHAVGLMTVGIIGFGCIGRKVADRLLPFGCKVVVYDPYVSADAIKEYGCTPVSLEELLKESDAVTLHMRLTESTKHILKAEHFAMMKPTAWLINTARAGLIDEQALIDAVTSHKIGGVALDVFDKEPLPADYPLIGLPDVILTPHIAGGTADGVELAVSAVIDDLVRFCKGESIVNVAKA